jgi:hypothetical protein
MEYSPVFIGTCKPGIILGVAQTSIDKHASNAWTNGETTNRGDLA